MGKRNKLPPVPTLRQGLQTLDELKSNLTLTDEERAALHLIVSTARTKLLTTPLLHKCKKITKKHSDTFIAIVVVTSFVLGVIGFTLLIVFLFKFLAS